MSASGTRILRAISRAGRPCHADAAEGIISSADNLFARTHLWYARFKKSVTDFPAGTWKTYTLWQFSSEMNCLPADRTQCLYTVPGTEYDMDVDVFNGTIEELRLR